MLTKTSLTCSARETRRYEFHRTRTQKSESYRFTKYVIVVRRQINSQGLPNGVEVDIRGPRLQKALLELNKDVSGFGFSDDPPQVRSMGQHRVF